jgi:hypothetical protein
VWRSTAGGFALTCLLLTAAILLERARITDWGTWWQQVRRPYLDRQTARERVRPGMTRGQVEAEIGEGSGGDFVTVSWCIKPGSGGAGPPYPLPYTRLEYPRFGFDVVYHCIDLNQPATWKVTVVEDRR